MTGSAIHLAPGAGFDTKGLQRLDERLFSYVETGRVAGLVGLLRHRDSIVYCGVHGRQSIICDTPMRADTIFRLHSMTKPITAAAMMLLHERGYWQFDDPLDGVLPELGNLQVLTGVGHDGALELAPSPRAPTLREAMSHTAGFGYGFTARNPVDKMFRSEDVAGSRNTAEFLQRIAHIPLLYPPGDRWSYSIASDLLGVVVERLAGKSFGAFLRDEIFLPLEMFDTGFAITSDKLDRLSDSFATSRHPGGGLITLDDPPGRARNPVLDYGRPAAIEAGGNGLLSTAMDYSRFCQSLLDSIEGRGMPLLSQNSMVSLSANQIPVPARDLANNLGMKFGDRAGYGFGVRVVGDRKMKDMPEPEGSLSWNGAGGTWFWVDRQNHLSFVGMMQCMDDALRSELELDTRQLVYDARRGKLGAARS